ncbi:hypothetical protein TRFO_16541 [Tritrichomonas foetus]|uniref:Transmembrane protein n=1 Tax=Tritrichomonas foetus TaxID=1144522 RepID=A0A1J4KQF4_9EUKA|nr:hypothetical protein TRFO_16541 [Tritrichomonas foetus]|eukprot:OHT13338.1 hypothetical protein TRFO_16541 [Tritrichomonas foetus]
MIVFLYFALAFSNIDDSSLPYDDEHENLENSPVNRNEDSNENPQLQSNQPHIPPPDSTTPLYILLASLFVFFLVSVVAYYLGKIEIENKMTKVQKSLNEFIQHDFKTEKVNFMQYGIHEFEVYFQTNDPNIYGCILHVEMALRCDIFHQIKYLFVPKVDKMTFEYLLHPSKRFSAMIHISKSLPYFSNDFELIESKIVLSNDLKCWSDVSGYEKDVVKLIQPFAEKHPKLIELIEMSDANRFKTRDKVGFVTRIEFNVSNYDEISNFETYRFGFSLAHKFVNIKIPDDVTKKNIEKRDKLLEKAKIRMEKIKAFYAAQAGMQNQQDVEIIGTPVNQQENTPNNEQAQSQAQDQTNVHEKTE